MQRNEIIVHGIAAEFFRGTAADYLAVGLGSGASAAGAAPFVHIDLTVLPPEALPEPAGRCKLRCHGSRPDDVPG